MSYLAKRVCKECGKPFETTSSRRLYCYEDHYRICKSCGKPFLATLSKIHQNVVTCSEQCRRLAISSAEIYKTPRFKCICAACGKEFLSATPKSKFCSDKHLRKCVVCGKEFEITEYYQVDRQTCSDECRYTLTHQKFMANVDSNIAKSRKTMIERYGTDSPFKVPEFIEKSKQTCLSRYGVTSFTKTPQYIEKTIETNRKRYGTDWYMQTDEYKESVVKTSLSKYGVTNPGMYGAFIVDKMKNPEMLSELMAFRDDTEGYIKSHFKEPPTLNQLSNTIGVSETTIGDIIIARNLCHLVTYQYSRMEDELYAFLSEHLDSNDIIRNTFKVITPYELDIYLPKFNLGIECDPTYTHNSTIGIYKQNPKSSEYHKMKTDLCAEKGIRLFHLFGYDWSWHKETCKSMILNAINQTPNRYYARKLNIATVSGKEAYDFLNENHRQGAVHCKVRLGLYNDTELLALMTFSKLRHTIGTGNDTTKECWELVRFCNKNYTTVVGGASRLLKYFIDNYHPIEIRSFSDRAHTSGQLYEQLGFTAIRYSEPGYVWVCLKTNKAYSRYNAQKHNIKRFLQDDTVDLAQSEVSIMSEHGYVQVYDSGTITWQLFSEV